LFLDTLSRIGKKKKRPFRSRGEDAIGKRDATGRKLKWVAAEEEDRTNIQGTTNKKKKNTDKTTTHNKSEEVYR